jgi:hypothetical protein
MSEEKKHILDLSFSNSDLYRGCKVTPVGDGRYRLDTPLDSATVMVASNALDISKRVSEPEQTTLVLTGGAPPAIYLSVFSIASPFFKRVVHLDGNKKVETDIPSPPPDFPAKYEVEP